MKSLFLFIATLFVIGIAASAFSAQQAITRVVNIPDEDRFNPYVVTIHVGDSVEWINNDTDDHTIVSNDKFTTAGHKGTNHIVSGTENTGVAGTYTLKFNSPGKFVYFCRFHAKLDKDQQPIAPGPQGGIQDTKGNFGTPMNGVIVVLPVTQ